MMILMRKFLLEFLEVFVGRNVGVRGELGLIAVGSRIHFGDFVDILFNHRRTSFNIILFFKNLEWILSRVNKNM